MKFRFTRHDKLANTFLWRGLLFGPPNLLFFDYVTLYTPLLDNFLAVLCSLSLFLFFYFLPFFASIIPY